jgi:hypothetical protein
MTFTEPVGIDVERTEGGVALVLTADRSRPSKRIHGAQVERIRLTREGARKLIAQIEAALA